MERFQILGNFLISGLLFTNGVEDVSVLHDVDNVSDHGPIILKLLLDVRFIGFSERVRKSQVSWVKSTADRAM